MLPDLKKFPKSLRYAWNGLKIAYRENNFRIQILFALLVIATGLFFEIRFIEWCVLLICISAVLCAELFNTAIEKLCDHLHPEHHPAIGVVKDLSAAAVLVTALMSLIVGMIIFSRYFTL